MWGIEPQNINEARERELSSKFFRPALDQGAQMVRHYNTTQSAQDIVRKIMGNQAVALQIQRELVDERKDIIDTTAGGSIKTELQEQITQHQAELRGIREEMMQVLRENNEEMRRELEEERRILEEWMKKITKDLEMMAADYAEEKERMEARMAEMEQKKERDEVEFRRQLADLTHRLQGETNMSMADRAEQQVKNPRPQEPTLITSYV